jgi:hypothetical protein
MIRKRWMRYLVTVASFPLANHLAHTRQVETCFNVPGIGIVGYVLHEFQSTLKILVFGWRAKETLP